MPLLYPIYNVNISHLYCPSFPYSIIKIILLLLFSVAFMNIFFNIVSLLLLCSFVTSSAFMSNNISKFKFKFSNEFFYNLHYIVKSGDLVNNIHSTLKLSNTYILLVIILFSIS